MRRTALILMAVAFVMAGFAGCKDDPAAPAQTPANRAPGEPAINTGAGAPADGATGRSISTILHWTCSDPDGDALTFEVFFGQNADPPSVATDHASMSYTPALAYSTTYYWKIIAEDPDGETTSSAIWSFTTMDEPAETVSVPDTPTGPASGDTGASLSYSTGGATNSLGHSVEYRFDWDDGSYSAWSASTSESHSWASAGTYNVKAQARCATHTNIESAWSTGIDITISAAQETVSIPTGPTGSATGTTIQTLTYNAGASTSSLGHIVEFRFDWGDGNYSTWTVSPSGQHNWPTAGSYDVRAQARCRDHTAIESAWTDPLTVTITEVVETVTIPNVSTSTEYVDLGEEAAFRARYSSSNVGHDIEYQFDFGDGELSAWIPGDYNGVNGAHTYAAVGTYMVIGRARCALHTDIESAWSTYGATVNVVSGAETISTPVIEFPVDEDDRTIMVGDNIQIREYGAESNLHHDLEYRFDMGDGYISPWSLDHWIWYYDYNTVGDYQVKVQARCAEHTDIESEWSAEITIHVLLAEEITRPDVSGPSTGVVGQEYTFTTNGSTSDLGHDLEYRLWISTSVASLGNPEDWTTIDNLKYTFTQARRWYVRVQARCTTHTHAESDASYPAHQITISNP